MGNYNRLVNDEFRFDEKEPALSECTYTFKIEKAANFMRLGANYADFDEAVSLFGLGEQEADTLRYITTEGEI